MGDNNGSFNSETPASSQTSGYEGSNRTSRYKIMTVKRGFSLEGDEILDYLVRIKELPCCAVRLLRTNEFPSQEKGAFDALEKQYLKRMIFALYIVCLSTFAFTGTSFISIRTRKIHKSTHNLA